MGRDIHFYRNDCKPLENESDEDFSDRERVANVDLGSGDAWPCYWRPIMVGAYKRILASNEYSEEKKAKILRSILACCPPSHDKTNNDNLRCGYYHTPVASSFMGLSSNRQTMLDERNLFDESRQLDLDAAGVWSIIELVLMHNRMCLTTPTIKRVSQMMELVRNFVPFSDDNLKGTPYEEVDDYYNLADERWIELFDAFKLAAAEENIYARIE
jgi:hypothetical protein